MTAPLPPLPFTPLIRVEDWSREPVSYWTQEQMQSYAKLAVRESLERARLAVKEAKENAFPQSADEAIRAMIEEYK